MKESTLPEPDVKPPEERAQIHAQLAGNYLQRGQLEVAIQEIEQALELDKTNKSANYIMGLVQVRLKKPDQAERYFKKAIALPDPLPNAQHDYANILCKKEEYKQAEDLYRELLNNPLYQAKARLLMNVGACFYKQEKYDEAENALKQSLRMNPNNALGLYEMARISHIKGKALETRGWYQRFFQISKGNAEILYIAYLTCLLYTSDAADDLDSV